MTERIPLRRIQDSLGMGGESWAAWHTLGKCVDGLPLDAEEMPLFEQCTGRTRPPTGPVDEVVVIKGRRCGGGRFIQALSTRAAITSYPLSPGERAVIGIAASDRDQARIDFGYAEAPFVPDAPWGQTLAHLVTRHTRWSLDLTTGATIEVRTSSYGGIRGRTFALAVADELAFWEREDGGNPASEVLTAIRPALVTLRGLLACITTPFSKSGPAWENFTRFWGVEDAPVLVWRAASRVMNPLIPEAVVQAALERDEVSARAEWLAEFRDDAGALVTRETLAHAVVPGLGTQPPEAGLAYMAFVDVATGSGADSMAMAIAHVEEVDGEVVAGVDRVDEVRPPFDPLVVARAFAATLHTYGIREAVGDRFAAGWVNGVFEGVGITYVPSELTRSELYLEFLLHVNAHAVALPDDARLLDQLVALQRRPGGQGRESVDHATGRHDDRANVVCGALVTAHRVGRREAVRVW